MNNVSESILYRIAEHKKEEVATSKKQTSLTQLETIRRVEKRDFISALTSSNKPAIIAEIKRASPSKGIIREDFNVTEIAQIYEKHGASCLSVLTDKDFFKGDPSFLSLAKKSTTLPVLRKDFIIDPYQIQESLALQADCILLIVAILDPIKLLDFCQMAHELGLSVLVESHDEYELEKALQLPTPLMGINNRSLHNFRTDITQSTKLAQLIPDDKIIISESGINKPSDIKYLQSHGINSFLIGESLMRENDIAAKLDELIGT